MLQQESLPVFLSVTMPHLPEQEAFLAAIASAMAQHGMTPLPLDRNEWSFEAPLIPIRQLMIACYGTVVIAMARGVVTEGVDYVNGEREQRYFQRYIATPWTQIETAMAFQLGHPILVLKEDIIHPEGVLDPANSGLFVRTFSPSKTHTKDIESIVKILPAFRNRVEAFATRMSAKS